MKVLDKLTGATLESDNELVTGQWAARPERYAPVKRERKESADAKGDRPGAAKATPQEKERGEQ